MEGLDKRGECCVYSTAIVAWSSAEDVAKNPFQVREDVKCEHEHLYKSSDIENILGILEHHSKNSYQYHYLFNMFHLLQN